MTLAEIDRLNILYFGDMQLPAKEKALRVRMAAEFEVLVRKSDQLIYNEKIAKKIKR